MRSKMILVLSVLGMLLISALPALAQDDQRTIQVTGIGSAFGAPDTATVEVGVDIKDADFGTAFDNANSIMDTVLAEITNLGIASEDIRTTAINVWFEDEHNRETGMPTGERSYHVSQSLRVVVRDIDMIGDVITRAVDNGANQIYGLNFTFSDTASLEQTARETAVENAFNKAEHLADLMEVELGEIVSVVDFGGSGSPQPLGRGGAFDTAESIAIAPGQLSVTSTVQVTFAIR